MIFLKRKEESSRYSLEEAVVIRQPVLEGPSGTWGRGINRGAEQTTLALSLEECVHVGGGVCAHGPRQGCRRKTQSSWYPVPQQTIGT